MSGKIYDIKSTGGGGGDTFQNLTVEGTLTTNDIQSDQTNMAGVVGVSFDTPDAYTDSDAKLVIFNNNGTTKAFVDKDGYVVSKGKKISSVVNTTNMPVTQVWSDAPGAGMVAITDMYVDVVTRVQDEVVEVSYWGEMVSTAAAADIILGYQVDSNTPVACAYSYQTLRNAYIFPVGFSHTIVLTGPPGTYRVKLCASKTTGSPVLACRVAEGTATDQIPFVVTQY